MSLLDKYSTDEIIERIKENIEWWDRARDVVKDKSLVMQAENHMALYKCMLDHFLVIKKKELANENH